MGSGTWRSKAWRPRCSLRWPAILSNVTSFTPERVPQNHTHLATDRWDSTNFRISPRHRGPLCHLEKTVLIGTNRRGQMETIHFPEKTEPSQKARELRNPWEFTAFSNREIPASRLLHAEQPQRYDDRGESLLGRDGTDPGFRERRIRECAFCFRYPQANEDS